MKLRLILILFTLVLYSCVRTLPDEEFSMARTHYIGKEIRLDGCYTTKFTQENKYVDYTFFYSNGVVLSFSDFPNIEQKNQIPEGIWNSKLYWGIFQITNNLIKVQRWDFTDVTFVRQYVVKYENYTIINDTTLFYENSRGYKANYYFKKFSPKPDSTNVFIK